MVTLSDLLAPQSRREVLDRLLALYRSAGFPATSWQAGNVARHLTEAMAAMLADLGELIAAIAKGGFLDHAEREWLDLLAWNVFAERRKAAELTRGVVRLRDAAGAGPFIIEAGSYWVANRARTRRFRNVEEGTLPAGGTRDLLFEAESPGAAWNVASDELVELLSPGGTGIQVSNPPGGRGTWITQQGTDAETDPALRQRCRDKWATLGSGSTESAYRYWATTASSEVTRVKITGEPTTGTVSVRVAGTSGPISQEALARVSQALDSRRPLTVGVGVIPVLAQVVPLHGTLYLRPGVPTDVALEQAKEAVDAYARESEIGGVVFRSRLIAALMSPNGVRNVALTHPADDVMLGADRVFVPTYSLATPT